VKRILFIAQSLLLLTLVIKPYGFCQEVSKVGTTAAKFLSISVGSRALAMGGAFVAVADDATAMYWNPGGVSRLQNKEIVLLHSEWLADINFEYAGIVLPVGNMGTLGFNFTSMDMGEMDITTEEEPEGTGETFSVGSFAFGLTYAYNLTDRFSIGANVKYIVEHIWNCSAKGLAIDIGTLFTTPFRGIRLGACISNFGQKMRIQGDDLLVQKDIDAKNKGNNESVNAYLGTDKFDLPLLLRIGISMDVLKTRWNRLTLSIDGNHPNDNTESVNIGGEYALFNETIFLRAGHKSLFCRDGEDRFVFGGGVKYNLIRGIGLKIDYAYEQFVHLKDVQKFSLGLTF